MPDVTTARRFPPPWTIEEYNDACFIVRDKSGQGLGYFYFEEEPGRREAANLLTKDEARRLAVNLAKAAGAVAQTVRTVCFRRAGLSLAVIVRMRNRRLGHNCLGLGCPPGPRWFRSSRRKFPCRSTGVQRCRAHSNVR